MSTPQKVLWTEGLFLTPQHLQQQDRYHEAYVSARVGALSPYDWGVLELALDAEALAAGQLQVLRFAGVLPDGTPLAFERGQPGAPAARHVDEAVPATQRTVEVFLGVPAERAHAEGGAGDGAAADGGTGRYAAVGRAVADAHAVGSVVQVPFGQPRVRLLLGAEPRDDLAGIKIAELERGPSGAWAQSETYVPPCLRLSAAPVVVQGLRQLLRAMVGKQRELSEARRQRDAASLEFSAPDVTRYLQLTTLNAIIPVVNHLVDAADLPPQQVYLLLLQAVGQLFTFGAEGDPSSLPRFQYTNLRATFEELFLRATRLLRAVAVEQSVGVVLEQRQPGLFVGRLVEERVARSTQFVLALRSALPEQQLVEQVPRLTKVASVAEISAIVQAAAPGVPLAATHRPPPEVPVKAGQVYFTVDTAHPYWLNAARDRTVAIYLPQVLDPARTQVELLAVPAPVA